MKECLTQDRGSGFEPHRRHCVVSLSKVSKGAKIWNRYNQVPLPTQDTNGKVTNSQLDTTNESQGVSPFPAGDHKAHINRRAQRHSKQKTEQNIKDSQKKYRLGMVSKIFYWQTHLSLLSTGSTQETPSPHNKTSTKFILLSSDSNNAEYA